MDMRGDAPPPATHYYVRQRHRRIPVLHESAARMLEEKFKTVPWWQKPIHPNSSFRQGWDSVTALTLLFLIFLVPLEAGFPWWKIPDSLAVTAALLDLWFAMDIVLNFRTGYILNGNVVLDNKKIAENYLKGYFLIDLLGTIPFDILAPGTLSQHNSSVALIKYFKIPKLLRLGRLVKYFRQYMLFFDASITLIAVVSSAHLMGCVWMAAINPCPAGNESDACKDSHIWVVYTEALMVAASLILGISNAHTVASQDILSLKIEAHSSLNSFYLLSTFLIILGVVLFGVLLGQIVALVFMAEQSTSAFRKKMDRIKQELEYYVIPPKLRSKVKAYHDYVWINQRMFNDRIELLSDENMSTELRRQLALHLYADVVRSISLFAETPVSDKVLGSVCTRLRTMIFLPNDTIIRKGDIGKDLFIVIRGVVQVMASNMHLGTHAGLHSGQPFAGDRDENDSEHSSTSPLAGMTAAGLARQRSRSVGTDSEQSDSGIKHLNNNSSNSMMRAIRRIRGAGGVGGESGSRATQYSHQPNEARPRGKNVFLTSGAVFGEIALLMEIRRTSTVIATTVVEVSVLDQTAFDQVIKESPEFAKHMKALAAEHMNLSMQRQHSFAGGEALKREAAEDTTKPNAASPTGGDGDNLSECGHDDEGNHDDEGKSETKSVAGGDDATANRKRRALSAPGEPTRAQDVIMQNRFTEVVSRVMDVNIKRRMQQEEDASLQSRETVMKQLYDNLQGESDGPSSTAESTRSQDGLPGGAPRLRPSSVSMDAADPKRNAQHRGEHGVSQGDYDAMALREKKLREHVEALEQQQAAILDKLASLTHTDAPSKSANDGDQVSFSSASSEHDRYERSDTEEEEQRERRMDEEEERENVHGDSAAGHDSELNSVAVGALHDAAGREEEGDVDAALGMTAQDGEGTAFRQEIEEGGDSSTADMPVGMARPSSLPPAGLANAAAAQAASSPARPSTASSRNGVRARGRSPGRSPGRSSPSRPQSRGRSRGGGAGRGRSPSGRPGSGRGRSRLAREDSGGDAGTPQTNKKKKKKKLKQQTSQSPSKHSPSKRATRGK